MVSKKRKKYGLAKKNTILLLVILLIAAAAELILQNSTVVKHLTNKGQNDTVNNAGANTASQDTIDCSKKLSQKSQSEIEKMISQDKANPNDCLHMGCGNFF